MRIKPFIKGFRRCQGLTIELRDSNGTIIGTSDKIKKNRFKLKLDQSPLQSSKKASIQATLIDNNGEEANFTSGGIQLDLAPDSQTFNFKLNNRKKAQSLKLKPKTQKLEVDELSEPSWSLGTLQSLGAAGVSPHLEQTSTGYRLSYAADGGLTVADLSNTFTLTPRGSMDRAADLTVITTAAGARRAYYVELNPQTKFKEIFSADISDDGLSLSNRLATGFSDQGALAWGVPDAVRLPDGRVRLYWVEDPNQAVQADEIIVSATSTDASGTTFQRDSGSRTTGGYVDFEVLKAEAGDWLAVMSSSPETIPNRSQGIYVGTSSDGLTWNVQPDNLAPTQKSYLDPTGVAIGPNQWQLVLSESESVLGDRDYTLMHTTLSLA
tara:strand:+ start:80 stop:1222 length:1143 start_codon:yes stop_codon:yes gene_type:complete